MTLINLDKDLEVIKAAQARREPGNATRYDVLAFRVRGDLYAAMGRVTDGWVVVWRGHAGLFQHKETLAPYTVASRFDISKLSEGDAPHITRAIADLIEGEVVT